MNIYVSKELQNLINELNDRGYNIVNTEENTKCEAIICDLKNTGLIDLVKMDGNFKAEGTLIIDSSGKTIEQIEYILKNKS